jgi:hypothetical protein
MPRKYTYNHKNIDYFSLRKAAGLPHVRWNKKEPEYDPFADNDNNADIFTASKDDGICKRCGKPIDYYNLWSHCQDLNRHPPDRYYHPDISED